MASQWVMDEMQSVDLRDKRLEKRLVQLIDTLSEASTASIPAACHNHAEMTAAYRFFDNDKVEFENVLQPHIDASYRRVAKQNVVLLVQDTTELDLTRPDSQVIGAGPLNHANKQGALLHLLHAFTPDGTPLGTLSAEAWTREPKDEKPKAKRGSSEKRVQIARKPFEEKETVRWLQTAEHCEEIKQHSQQTQLVMLADRECDITEVIDYCTKQQSFDWVIRSDVDRVLNKARKQDTSIKVRDLLGSTKPLYRQQLSIRSREQWGSQSLKQRPGKADRDARLVDVSVHAGQITLNDPRVGHRDGVNVSAVLVQEIDPPGGVQPVQWLLLTSLPIKTRKEVELVIEYYLMRWMIENYQAGYAGRHPLYLLAA